MAIEEQTQRSAEYYIGYEGNHRFGQRLTIPNRTLTKLGFWIRKSGSPPGTLTFEIYRKSDSGLLASKLWGNANDLTTSVTYEEVTFDTPVLIDAEVYIVITASGTDPANRTRVSYTGEVKADENICWHNGGWSEEGSADCAYRYTYEDLPTGGGGPVAALIAAGII